MENEKSVYEILQEQINRQDKTIEKLLKIIKNMILSFIFIIFIMFCSITIIVKIYFDAPVMETNTEINGNNNSTTNNNELSNQSGINEN